jgi:alpha-tubulin suppressor-like RCC1 family protein
VVAHNDQVGQLGITMLTKSDMFMGEIQSFSTHKAVVCGGDTFLSVR